MSEGTQCHNMVHAFIGDVSLPARRHVEWRGEPVVEIPGKYVVQGEPASHCSAGGVQAASNACSSCYSHITQLLFTTSIFQEWPSSCRVGDLQTLQDLSGQWKDSNGQNAKETNVQCLRILVGRHVDVPKPLLSRNTTPLVSGVAIMRHVWRLRETKKTQIMTAVDGSNLHVTTQCRMMCPKKKRTSCNRQLNAGPSTQSRAVNSTQDH